MAIQLINIGSSVNKGDGDPLRTAFAKINGNFNELAAATSIAFPTQSGQSGKFLTTDGSSLSWAAITSAPQLTNNGHTVTVNSDGNITVDGNIYSTAPVITVNENPPAGAVTGNLWYDTESGRTYVYYDTSWVDANPKGATGSTLPNQNGNTGKYLTTDGSNLSWATPPALDLSSVAQDIVPDSDNTRDLGSPTNQWRHVYTAGGSIYLDNIKLSNVGGKFTATKVVNPGEENEAPDPEDSDATSNIGGGADNPVKTYIELTNQAAPLDIWAGDWIEFTHTDNGNEVDQIDEGLSITRGENQGIYNPELEEGWDNTNGDPDGRVSPKGTVWNSEGWADLTNLDQRTYQTFYDSVGGNFGNNVLSPQFIMKDVANNAYYKVDFTVWGNNNNGAPVTYTRQQVNPVDGTDIGDPIEFVKPGYADPFIVFYIVSPQVHISRGNNQSIFNTVSETGYNNNSPGDGDGENSPAGTLWNLDGWRDLTDVKQRTYVPLLEAFDWGLGVKIVNSELVMYDTANNKYHAIKFTQWTGQGNGGGFAYRRRLINADVIFVHTENGNEVDDIAEGIGITRDSQYGIYNPYDEGSWDDAVSPGGTEWNFDGTHDLSDVESRHYTTFFAAQGYWGIGNKIEGKEAVMRLIGTNTYFTIKFLHWQAGGGGAFSYIRTPIDLTKVDEGIRFADGTVQKTSASDPTKFRGPLGRRIEKYYGYKQVNITQATSYTLDTTMRGNYTDSDYVQFNVLDLETQQQFSNGSIRNVAVSFDNGTTWITLDRYAGSGNWPPGNYYVAFNTADYAQIATYTDGQSAKVKYWRGGEPQLWFDPEKSPGGDGDFRGAIIEYHAYSRDEGTIVGQIMLARDSGDYHITHSEVNSGGSGLPQVNLWRTYQSETDYNSGEGKLYAWRINGSDDTIKIQWQATMFYGSEFWD